MVIEQRRLEGKRPGAGDRQRGPDNTTLFDKMCEQHAAPLHRWLVSRGRNAAEASDLVQEAFERALRAQPPVASQDELRAWLVVVVRRLFIDSSRATIAHRWVSANFDREPAPAEDATPLWKQIDIEEAVSGIAPRLRAVVELQAAGCSQRQIAERLKIKVATVGTRLFRARQLLRRLLAGPVEENLGRGRRPRTTFAARSAR